MLVEGDLDLVHIYALHLLECFEETKNVMAIYGFIQLVSYR